MVRIEWWNGGGTKRGVGEENLAARKGVKNQDSRFWRREPDTIRPIRSSGCRQPRGHARSNPVKPGQTMDFGTTTPTLHHSVRCLRFHLIPLGSTWFHLIPLPGGGRGRLPESNPANPKHGKSRHSFKPGQIVWTPGNGPDTFAKTKLIYVSKTYYRAEQTGRL